MIYFAAALIAIFIAQGLFSAGVPPLALLVASTLVLLFWHRLWGVVAAGKGWVSQSQEKARRLEDAQWEAEQNARKAEQKARMAALCSEAEAIFEEHAEEAVFLIEERDGYRHSRSKIGGCPTLPSGMHWPERNEMAMHFLAEIHLDEVPRSLVSDALPREGALYFFLNLGEFSDLVDGCVLYAPEPGSHSIKRPPNLAELEFGFARQPGHDNLLIETAVRPTVATVPHLSKFDCFSVSQDLSNCLGDVAIRRYKETAHANGLVEGRQHLKIEDEYVFNMIGGPKLDIPNPTRGRGIKLLQLDSSGSLGLQFGDMGVVEFWIDEEDLRMGRFERAFVDNASC